MMGGSAVVHLVANNGDEDRVRVIMDFVLPVEKCCCGEKRHPDALCSPRPVSIPIT
jgi:hypothetical protein